MKYFIFSMLLLSVFLFTNVFAQSESDVPDIFTEENITIFMKELGLPESSRASITREDIESFFVIPDENTPFQQLTIPDELLQTESDIPPFILPGLGQSAESIVGAVSCFDYYEFGSVQATFGLTSQSVVNGMEATFVGEIENKNNYPLVDGKLYVKIFKKRGTEKNVNGPDVVDQFVAIENITLDANEVVPMDFTWQVPAYIDSGEFTMATYFITEDKFNFSGLSFTDDITGNKYNFKVNSQNDSVVRFDKESAFVNENRYYFAANPPRVDQSDPATIKLDIKNYTDTSEVVDVKWSVYKWDTQQEGNLIEEYTEKYDVGAGGVETISTSINNNEHPVYQVVAELTYKDTKSIANIRFVRGDIDKVRLNFPSILKYPLTPNEPQTIFACVHNSGTSSVVPNNKLIMTLKDLNGKVIDEYVYEGSVTGEMMAVKHQFDIKKQYANFALETKLYTNDVLVDSSSKEYRCEDINEEYCPPEKSAFGKIFSIKNISIALFGIIILMFTTFIIRKKLTKNISTVSLLFFSLVLSLGVLVPSQTEAKSVTWTGNTTQPLEYHWNRWMENGWARGLGPVNISVTYHTKITNLDTGEVLQGGESLPEGTRLKFDIGPFDPTDISWFGTGHSMDSPYGDWGESISNSSAPVTCDQDDYVSTAYLTQDAYGNQSFDPEGNSQALRFDVYVKAMVSKQYGWPEYYNGYTASNAVSLTSASNGTTLGSCSIGYFLNSNSYSYTCTLGTLPPGTESDAITAGFYFPKRVLSFFYRYFDYRTMVHPTTGAIESPGCYGNNVSMMHPGYTEGSMLVTRQDVPYSFNVSRAGGNTNPTAPVITGPTTLRSGASTSFSFVSTDPDGDKIRYQMDWNNDGVFDESAPAGDNLYYSGSWVNSGVSQSKSKSFTVFPVTFKVRTLDIRGGISDWTTHTITQKTGEYINFLSGSTNPELQGSMSPQLFTFNVPQALSLNKFAVPGWTVTGWKTYQYGSLAYTDGAMYTMAPTDTSVNLYANWVSNPYRYIRFNSNGGSGSTMNGIGMYDGQTVKLSKNTYIRTGHTFASWNTAANGSGTRYGDETNITVIQNTTYLDLYAQWINSPILCSTEHENGDSVCKSNKVYEYKCAPDGVWNLVPTGAICVSTLGLSCVANPLEVSTGENTTFTATANESATYTWRDRTNAVLGTGNQLTKSYPTSDSDTEVFVSATSTESNLTGSASCTVTVNNCAQAGQTVCRNGYVNEYQCNGVNQTLVPTTTLCSPSSKDLGITVNRFEFSPQFVATSAGMCTLYVDVDGAQECRIIKDNRVVQTYTHSSSTISATENLSIGTYELRCAVANTEDPTNLTFGSYGVQKCIVNPSVKEN